MYIAIVCVIIYRVRAAARRWMRAEPRRFRLDPTGYGQKRKSTPLARTTAAVHDNKRV